MTIFAKTTSRIIDPDIPFTPMRPKQKRKKLRITEKDFMLANRRAARLEDIAQHGKPTAFRAVLHTSKKAYNRKRFKKELPEGGE